MNTTILILTCLSIFLIVYHHVLYPIILENIQKIKKPKNLETNLNPYNYRDCIHPDNNKQEKKGEIIKHLNITIVVPAYNERKYIEEKINNLASMDYPRNQLKIIIACDGCTDGTNLIAEKSSKYFPDIDISVINFPKNRGKCAVINDVLSQINTDLVAFSDTSSIVSLDSLNICNTRFKDERIGGINGNYRMLKPVNAGEDNYWKYQNKIKMGEEALGSILGAHGAFYVIRTKLFRTLPESTINDDFVIPMRVIEQGYKVIYESRINAIELETSNNTDNWKRRQRIGFGNTQQLVILKNLLNPKFHGVSFAFISGKALRVLMPFIMVYTLISSLYCAVIWPIFIPIALGQLSIYMIALFSEYTKKKNTGKISKTIHYLVAGHTANLLGSINYLTRSKAQW